MFFFRCISDFRPTDTLRATGNTCWQQINLHASEIKSVNNKPKPEVVHHLGSSPALELGYSPTLVLGCKRYLEMQSGVGARMQEGTAAREQLRTRGGCKNNKALIKADNLKGLLGYPTYKPLGFTSAILKIEDKKIC